MCPSDARDICPRGDADLRIYTDMHARAARNGVHGATSKSKQGAYILAAPPGAVIFGLKRLVCVGAMDDPFLEDESVAHSYFAVGGLFVQRAAGAKIDLTTDLTASQIDELADIVEDDIQTFSNAFRKGEDLTGANKMHGVGFFNGAGLAQELNNVPTVSNRLTITQQIMKRVVSTSSRTNLAFSNNFSVYPGSFGEFLDSMGVSIRSGWFDDPYELKNGDAVQLMQQAVQVMLREHAQYADVEVQAVPWIFTTSGLGGIGMPASDVCDTKTVRLHVGIIPLTPDNWMGVPLVPRKTSDLTTLMRLRVPPLTLHETYYACRLRDVPVTAKDRIVFIDDPALNMACLTAYDAKAKNVANLESLQKDVFIVDAAMGDIDTPVDPLRGNVLLARTVVFLKFFVTRKTSLVVGDIPFIESAIVPMLKENVDAAIVLLCPFKPAAVTGILPKNHAFILPGLNRGNETRIGVTMRIILDATYAEIAAGIALVKILIEATHVVRIALIHRDIAGVDVALKSGEDEYRRVSVAFGATTGMPDVVKLVAATWFLQEMVMKSMSDWEHYRGYGTDFIARGAISAKKTVTPLAPRYDLDVAIDTATQNIEKLRKEIAASDKAIAIMEKDIPGRQGEMAAALDALTKAETALRNAVGKKAVNTQTAAVAAATTNLDSVKTKYAGQLVVLEKNAALKATLASMQTELSDLEAARTTETDIIGASARRLAQIDQLIIDANALIDDDTPIALDPVNPAAYGAAVRDYVERVGAAVSAATLAAVDEWENRARIKTAAKRDDFIKPLFPVCWKCGNLLIHTLDALRRHLEDATALDVVYEQAIGLIQLWAKAVPLLKFVEIDGKSFRELFSAAFVKFNKLINALPFADKPKNEEYMQRMKQAGVAVRDDPLTEEEKNITFVPTKFGRGHHGIDDDDDMDVNFDMNSVEGGEGDAMDV
jgi:hypothetical protein